MLIYGTTIATIMAGKSKTKKQKEEEAAQTEVVTMEEDLEPEIKIEDLPGVYPATAEKLREAGFDEMLALAVMSPGDLAEQAELEKQLQGKSSRLQRRWQILADSYRDLHSWKEEEK